MSDPQEAGRPEVPRQTGHAAHDATGHAEMEAVRAEPLPEGITRAYYAAFVLLLVLTAIEASTVLVFSLPAAVRVIVLLISASIKATLIAAYYMNLKFERVAMIGIAISPLLLAVLMFFMIAPDAAQRFGAR